MIVHMQRRLSKHDGQKMKKRGGWLREGGTNKTSRGGGVMGGGGSPQQALTEWSVFDRSEWH